MDDKLTALDQRIAEAESNLDQALDNARAEMVAAFAALGFTAKVRIRRGQIYYGAKTRKVEKAKVTA